MSSLTDLALRDVLPPSISSDDQLCAVADAVDPESQAIALDVATYLPFMANLDNVPERIVDLLAWQFHVDFYELDAEISVKRALVRDAVHQHRIHGTLAAVGALLDKIFGAGQTEIAEWFEYGGEPYTFMVWTRGPLEEEDIARFTTAVQTVKNVRSHCTFQQIKSDGFTVYVAFVPKEFIYHTEVAN